MRTAAIVLCGGKSTRMGRSKAMLPFGTETLLERVLRLVSPVVDHQIVVAAQGQPIPSLPGDIQIVRDQFPERGPLEGIRVGLKAGMGVDDLFFVTSCDVPLLQPEIARFLFSELRTEDQLIIPRDEQHLHPLTAVYRSSVLPYIEALLHADRRRPRDLLELVPHQIVDVERLRAFDPDLHTFRNVNRQEDYLAALREIGIEAAEDSH